MESNISGILESNFNRVFKELAELKNRLDALEGKPQPVQRPVENPIEQPAAKPQATPQTQPNQMTGEFSPEDVSIEKFFYAGPKE